MSVTQAQSIALHFLVTSLMLFGHSKKKKQKKEHKMKSPST